MKRKLMQNRSSVHPALFKFAQKTCAAFSPKNTSSMTVEQRKKRLETFPFFSIISAEKARILWDPSLSFEIYQTAFPEFTKAEFQALHSDYPYGVEIFIESPIDSNRDEKEDLKNQFTFHQFVATRLIDGLEKSACELIEAHFFDLPRALRNEAKQVAYLESIKNKKIEWANRIGMLKSDYFFNDLKKIISEFENQLAAIIASYREKENIFMKESVDEAAEYLTNKKNQFNQALLDLKQQQFKTFSKDGNVLKNRSLFGADILVIQLKLTLNKEWDLSEPASYVHYKRHYVLTDKQKKEMHYQKSQSVPSASSHTSHPVLPNYAQVENGFYWREPISEKKDSSSPKKAKQKQETILKTMSYARCGSAAPATYYKQKGYDPHKARYLTYLNMQQQMELSGAESLASASMAGQRKAVKPVIHLHNHLITPTGVGSRSENQRDQYRDMRLMAYAINGQLNSKGDSYPNRNQYLYFCQGINWARRDHTDDFKETQKRNNMRVLVDLYLAYFPIKLTLKDKYLFKLVGVQEKAKAYFQELDACQNTKKEISAIWRFIRALEKSEASQGDQKTIPKIRAEIERQKENLSQQWTLLGEQKKALNSSWKALRECEKDMLETAEFIFLELHEADQTISSVAKNTIQELFSIIFTLFYSGEKGSCDAEREKYNGLLPALMQILIYELNQNQNSERVFKGSMGCKSNNDRTVLVAAIIPELTFYIAKLKKEKEKIGVKTAQDASISTDKNTLSLDILKDLVIKAQEKYLQSGSQYLCIADGSALPKTEPSLMPEADQRQLKRDAKFASFAPHKRKPKLKETKQLIKMSMGLESELELKSDLYFSGEADAGSKANKSLRKEKSFCQRISSLIPDINHDWFSIWDQLRRYHTQTQYQNDQSRARHLNLIKKEILLNQEYFDIFSPKISDQASHQIVAEINLELSTIQSYDSTATKDFLMKIQERLGIQANSTANTNTLPVMKKDSKSDLGSGKGLDLLIKTLESFNSQTPNHQTMSPAQCLYQLQLIAAPRKKDWTAWFCNHGLFQDKRSLELQKIYEDLMNFNPQLFVNEAKKKAESNVRIDPTIWTQPKSNPVLTSGKKKLTVSPNENSNIDGSENEPELSNPGRDGCKR